MTETRNLVSVMLPDSLGRECIKTTHSVIKDSFITADDGKSYRTIRYFGLCDSSSPLESLANRNHQKATSSISETSGFFGHKISKDTTELVPSLFRILKYE